MGFHLCEYCEWSKRNSKKFPITSSGDVTMVFDSGHTWTMPDMILHYVADHQWLPPALFIADVMNGKLVAGERLQTKGDPIHHESIGYLSGAFETGEVPVGFIEKLEALMKQSDEMGQREGYLSVRITGRRQTRGPIFLDTNTMDFGEAIPK